MGSDPGLAAVARGRSSSFQRRSATNTQKHRRGIQEAAVLGLPHPSSTIKSARLPKGGARFLIQAVKEYTNLHHVSIPLLQEQRHEGSRFVGAFK